MAGVRDPAGALSEMRTGVEAIQEVQGQLQALAERVEGMAIQRAPTAVLEDIKKDIVAIRTEVAAKRSPNLEPLQQQIAELSRQMGSGRPVAATDFAPRGAQLQQLEERIARLQSHLDENRNESMEAAKAEARAAVRELSKMATSGEIDASIVGALMQDLDALRNSTADTDKKLRNKLDAVNQTLAQVVARLSQLEGAGARTQTARSVAPASAPAAPVASAPPAQVAATPAGREPVSSPERKAAVTAAAMPPAIEEPADQPALEDAMEATPNEAPQSDPRSSRADFIAAARRAAQAAAEEAAKNEEAAEAAKGEKSPTVAYQPVDPQP